MADLNEDKQLEEYIRQTLKNYSIPISEERKKELLHAYSHLKLQHHSIQVSWLEMAKNKTLQIIVASVLFITLFIYILVKLFPSQNKNPNDYKNHTTTIDTSYNKSDTIEKKSTDAISPHAPLNSAATASQVDTLKNETKQTLTTNTLSDTIDSKKFLKKNTDTLKSNITVQNKKKKKKRKKSEHASDLNSEEKDSPVIEPKSPELSPAIKEEE